jgi:hypothetical protein
VPRTFNGVDFPDPDGPTMPSISPDAMVRLSCVT